jgi:HEAT repeat protein
MGAKKENQRSVDRLLRTFERTGPDPRSITELVALLDHDQSAVRLLAIKFLGLAGPTAKEAVPLLEKQLQDPDAEIRRQSQSALDRIRKPS